MGLKSEAGGDPEVAAPAALGRPEQILVGLGIDLTDAAVGGDDRERAEIVGHQPPAPAGKAVATAEREAGNAHRRAGAAGHREAPPGQRGVHVDQLRPRPDRRAPAAHAHPVQPREVDHHPVADRGIARGCDHRSGRPPLRRSGWPTSTTAATSCVEATWTTACGGLRRSAGCRPAGPCSPRVRGRNTLPSPRSEAPGRLWWARRRRTASPSPGSVRASAPPAAPVRNSRRSSPATRGL